MNWFAQVVFIISVTTVIHKIINEISLSKFNKDKNKEDIK